MKKEEFVQPKRKSKFLIILSFIIIILLVCIIIIILVTRKRQSKMKFVMKVIPDDYILKYHLNNKTYSINSQNEIKNELINDFIINVEDHTTKFSNGKCDKTHAIGKNITKKEDSIILTSLFKDIFNNTNETFISVNDDNITSQNLDKILKVLENNILISKLEYEIIETKEQYNNNYKIKGYSYILENETVIYTIAMGEQHLKGYYINITKVDIKNNNAIIHVFESSPGRNEMAKNALIYPIIKIKFTRFPRNITILNDETGEIFFKYR